MASVGKAGKEESSSSTVSSTKGEDSSAPSIVNTFANDGSFLELFRKRMEAQSKERKVGSDCDEKQSEKKALGPTKSLTQQVWFSEKENAKIFPFRWKR